MIEYRGGRSAPSQQQQDERGRGAILPTGPRTFKQKISNIQKLPVITRWLLFFDHQKCWFQALA
jgi:hypothetical protein